MLIKYNGRFLFPVLNVGQGPPFNQSEERGAGGGGATLNKVQEEFFFR